MAKSNHNGSKGVHKKALFFTFVILAFIIGITVIWASLPGYQAEEGTGKEGEHREDALYVTRQSGTAGSLKTVAQPTIRPDISGTDEAVSYATREEGWTTGALKNESYQYNILVVLEFTNLKAQPLAALLYDADKTVIYEPSEISDGKIIFEVTRFKKGNWYLATKLPEGEDSLGTSVVSYITMEDYHSLHSLEEKEPLARDEFGGAITE